MCVEGAWGPQGSLGGDVGHVRPAGNRGRALGRVGAMGEQRVCVKGACRVRGAHRGVVGVMWDVYRRQGTLSVCQGCVGPSGVRWCDVGRVAGRGREGVR